MAIPISAQRRDSVAADVMKSFKPLLDYKKYRWFFTSSGRLVVGGKSAAQNDNLLTILKKLERNYLVMHTSTPGSPFSVILSSVEEVSEKEIEELAVFTACFSRAWKEQKKKVWVDFFSLKQMYKSKSMKTGTWGVKPPVKRKIVKVELVLTRQKNKIRAVPELTAKKKDILLKLKPGKLDKKEMLPKFQVLLAEPVNQEELLQALPPGGVAISKQSRKT